MALKLINKSKVMEEEKQSGGQITVKCGINKEVAALAGKTVGEIRKMLANRLNIDQGTNAFVNGKRAAENKKLEEGDTLEFVHFVGQKG